MKRIILSALALIALTIGLTACGDNGDNPLASTPSRPFSITASPEVLQKSGLYLAKISGVAPTGAMSVELSLPTPKSGTLSWSATSAMPVVSSVIDPDTGAFSANLTFGNLLPGTYTITATGVRPPPLSNSIITLPIVITAPLIATPVIPTPAS